MKTHLTYVVQGTVLRCSALLLKAGVGAQISNPTFRGAVSSQMIESACAFHPKLEANTSHLVIKFCRLMDVTHRVCKQRRTQPDFESLKTLPNNHAGV